MTTRRSFLSHTLTALAAVPLLAHAAFGGKPKEYTLGIDPGTGGPDQYAEHVVQVRGQTIKVPSNRYWVEDREKILSEGYWSHHHGYRYIGKWDGTFKEEVGCTNPAYILADLYERIGEEPDWVVALKTSTGKVIGGEVFKPKLNWRMLYDWGRWCDEPVEGLAVAEIIHPNGSINYFGRSISSQLGLPARFTVNTICQTDADRVQLREELRMHCLSWQSTDPRYRTSWPGTTSHPYAE